MFADNQRVGDTFVGVNTTQLFLAQSTNPIMLHCTISDDQVVGVAVVTATGYLGVKDISNTHTVMTYKVWG